MRDDDDDLHHQGLSQDLMKLRSMDRRQLLRWAAGAAAISIIGCGTEASGTGGAGGTGGTGGAGTGTGTTGATGSTSATGNGTCTAIPEETQGPYPGDGSNGANALTLSGIVRSDIRTSVAPGTATAAGIPLTVTLTVVDGSCKPLSGYAVYIWHCDRDGNYSMYSAAVASENYLRGVQATDQNGTVTFTTIFPACYSGRWPHIHFEVYPSLAKATSSANKVKTSQLAMPKATCDEVFATTGYETSVQNLAQTSLATDMVLTDSYAVETPAITGTVDTALALTMTVSVG